MPRTIILATSLPAAPDRLFDRDLDPEFLPRQRSNGLSVAQNVAAANAQASRFIAVIEGGQIRAGRLAD
jgi:hypothetical protein